VLVPVTTRDWIALISITLVGVLAWVWLLPWTERVPFVIPPEVYDRFPPRTPFAGQMNFTPVAVGIVLVTACCLLYGSWMSWSTSRPIRPRRAGR